MNKPTYICKKSKTSLDSWHINLSEDYIRGGYETHVWRGYVNCYSRRINRLLSFFDTSWIELADPFITSTAIADVRDYILSVVRSQSEGLLFDSDKVRLSSDLIPDDLVGGNPVRLQLARYFDYCVTNGFSQNDILRGDTTEIVYRGVDNFLDSAGRLLPLDGSPCSNHIGVSTIAITSDMQLVFTRQSSGNLESAGLLAPSGSGSADYADLQNSNGILQRFLISAAERELIEECSLTQKSRLDISTKLVGYARLLNRGGKPDFYAVSFLNVPFEAIGVAGKETQYVQGHLKWPMENGLVDLPNRIDDALAQLAQSMSCPLYLNLLFLKQFVEDNGSAWPDCANCCPNS